MMIQNILNNRKKGKNHQSMKIFRNKFKIKKLHNHKKFNKVKINHYMKK